MEKLHKRLPVAPIDNESSLLQRVADNDEKAFQQIFDHYKPFILRSAFRLTANEELAEDILQETFLKVWLNRRSLPEVQNFVGWLYMIYQNFMLNAIKRENRDNQGKKELKKDFGTRINLPDYQVEAKQVQEVINTAINRLPEKQQTTYRLIREQGFSRQEAAERLSVSPETVKTNLDVALKSIRAYCLEQLDKHPLAAYVIVFLKLFY